MVLYKATENGQIPMTKEEEAEIRADWAAAEERQKAPKPKTMEDLIKDLDKRVKALEKGK